jgi:hypothetical protein
MRPRPPDDPFDWGNMRWWFVIVVALCVMALVWIKCEGG